MSWLKGIKARRTKLRTMFYEDVRGFGLHSQIANDFFKDDVAILNNGGRVKRVTIPYNIPGSGMFAYAKNGNPVVFYRNPRWRDSHINCYGWCLSAV